MRIIAIREKTWPEDGLEALQHEGVQQRLTFVEDTRRAAHRRVAMAQGGSSGLVPEIRSRL